MALLRRACIPAIPVVAGPSITAEAAAAAADAHVVVVEGGHVSGWDEALAAVA